MLFYPVIAKPLNEIIGIKEAFKTWVEESNQFVRDERVLGGYPDQRAREIIQYSWKRGT